MRELIRLTDRSITRLLEFLIAGAGALLLASPAVAAVGWQNPAIEEYGEVRDFPQAGARPDPADRYRIVVDVTEGAKTPDMTGSGLEHVARLANLYALAGVPPERMQIVAVVHSDATATVLDDEHYRQKFGVANPNSSLLSALRTSGIEVVVCGQALASHQFEPAWVADEVEVVLAAMTALVKYQKKGYVLLTS